MRPALLPKLCHHTPFSSSSYDAYIQQRYWSCGILVHLGEKPLHQKKALCRQQQWGLNNNIMTYTFKPFSFNIPDLIMTHKCESPMVANHSMIRRKTLTTHTMIRDVGQSSTISKMYSIPEFTFSQMETLITKRENRQS